MRGVLGYDVGMISGGWVGRGERSGEELVFGPCSGASKRYRGGVSPPFGFAPR